MQDAIERPLRRSHVAYVVLFSLDVPIVEEWAMMSKGFFNWLCGNRIPLNVPENKGKKRLGYAAIPFTSFKHSVITILDDWNPGWKDRQGEDKWRIPSILEEPYAQFIAFFEEEDRKFDVENAKRIKEEEEEEKE